MEQLIQAFGIDIKLIVAQMINFGILLGLLTYFLYKPLLRLLNEREVKIAKGVEDAEAAAMARNSADEEKKIVLSKAHNVAEEINARAKKHAEEKATEIVAEAQEKATSVLVQAQTKGENLKALAFKESETEITKLAILAAEKILKEKSV